MVAIAPSADAATKKKKQRISTNASVNSNAKAKPAPTRNYGQHPEALALAQEIAQKHGFELDWVNTQMRQAQHLPLVVKLMQPAPSTAKKNWETYRQRAVGPVQIQAGVKFWQENAQTLARAEQEYGVPAHIVLGILGVETIYGRNTGSFRAIDALATLAFDYPQQHPRREARVAYFRGELAHLMLLSKALGREPAEFKGSFAGALGMPQFMPSSWLNYAVDFDNDQRIDLWQSKADVIGSVAKYFKGYGWQRDLITHYPIAPNATVTQPHTLIELENGDAPSTFLAATDNFFVITKYNNSYYYAAAVIELGAQIARAYHASPSSPSATP